MHAGLGILFASRGKPSRPKSRSLSAGSSDPMPAGDPWTPLMMRLRVIEGTYGL